MAEKSDKKNRTFTGMTTGDKTSLMNTTVGGSGDKSTKGKVVKIAKVVTAKVKSGDGGDADDLDAWIKSRQLLKPDDQLELTEVELSEEITKVLTPTNANVRNNLVIYSFKEGTFVQLPPESNTITLYELTGTSLHIDSEEAKDQMEESGEIGYPLPIADYTTTEIERAPSEVALEEVENEEEEYQQTLREGIEKDTEDIEEEVEEEEDILKEMEEDEGTQERIEQSEGEVTHVPAIILPKKRKLINQFNYCERSALTYTNPKRNIDTQTITESRSQFGSNVLQWIIYDSYDEDYKKQQKEKDKRDDKKIHRRDEHKQNKLYLKKEMENELNQKYLKCWQILERMINQNIYREIAHDYRYWEDPADEYREFEGTLLPLWKFQYERTKKLSVTDLTFNPTYYDLFAVCFGSHDFMKQPSEGSICFFTIKNPSYPDYMIMTTCGIMCCDIHPKYPFLVAVGLYDGTVEIYDLKDDKKKPLYASSGVNYKHTECVWEIKWGDELMDGEINFYSISSAGNVFNWILMQNSLMKTTIISLYLENGMVEGPDGTELSLMSCGSCMAFHPTDKEIFLIGTEEGFIYKCSTEYSSKYLMIYKAHNLSVYRIDFNRFNNNIFISCSGDWRVKIWEDMRAEPLFIFDLGSAVGDVKWAPFSSTVFAAVTNEGKVYVFDINVNKYRPICVQSVVPKRKNKLTRITFNEKLPFIIVGDDKGSVTSLKLSPNLRIMVKPPKKQLYLDQRTLQITKLTKLLSLVRELSNDDVIVDTATTVKS